MPELPEVEVVRRGVHGAVVGRTVRDVAVRAPSLRWPVPADLRARLAGQVLRDAQRRGKYLLLLLLVVAMVNLPLVHSTLRHRQIENDGVTTTAEMLKVTYNVDDVNGVS